MIVNSVSFVNQFTGMYAQSLRIVINYVHYEEIS